MLRRDFGCSLYSIWMVVKSRAPERIPPAHARHADRIQPSSCRYGRLAARIGDKFWSAPEKRLVRATIYKKEKGAADGHSAKGKSDGEIGLRYVTEKEAARWRCRSGCHAAGMVKIHTDRGVLAYIAADEGVPWRRDTRQENRARPKSKRRHRCRTFVWPSNSGPIS
jgi:hypothetical protein